MTKIISAKLNLRFPTIKHAVSKISSRLKITNSKNSLPVVSIPLVAYSVNYSKLAEELLKGYQPYTNALKRAKKEFEERNLPWNDSYADYYSGNLNHSGNSILSHYDDNKQNFIKAGLDFNNNLVNSSTGKLNSHGQTIWNNYEDTVEKLEEAHIPYNSNFFNKKTGRLTEYQQNRLGFKGSPEDGIDDSILASDPELARDLRELQSIDTSLSPELQEYRDLPDFDNPRELLEYFIGDELPDDVILDWDLWSVLETMWEELFDIGDWL
ncbi:TPA: hypothetical protein CPT95_10390 [Candidatus Gastranaerophilales bacterium HUM_15]|nr:MAG TPA: hypothetical protein CPT95_10390 [Candidatus Gastranaerophilales bacterium HUM_15]